MQITNPVRVERRYTQKLHGRPDDVFPLLCPVREQEWVEGWNPLVVYSLSGFAENNCIFTTGDEKPDSIWVITEFDSERHKLSIVKVTPGMTVAQISISLSQDAAGHTNADVVYLYTAISPDGEQFVNNYSEEFFEKFMQYSEQALNSFLDARSYR
jgi:hypothetical protein